MNVIVGLFAFERVLSLHCEEERRRRREGVVKVLRRPRRRL